MKTSRLDIAREPVADQIFDELAGLRQFAGPVAEFWRGFIGALGRLVRAHRGALVRRDPEAPDTLRKLLDWSDGSSARTSVAAFNQSLAGLAEKCFQENFVTQVIETNRLGGAQDIAVGVRLRFANDREQCAAVFLLAAVDEETARETVTRLQLAADVPRSYQANQSELHARQEVEKFVAVLDVLALVNAEAKFRGAALAFCNALATRFHCERVSLGWIDGGFVRLKTISRTERFDKRARTVRAIEVVMEEAVDQDEEIVWPAAPDCSSVVRDHEQFAREQDVAHLVSLPLRLDDKPVGAITCERQKSPFSELELNQLRLAADLVARRLSELRQWDRWFGARLAAATRERLGKWIGPEHTWAKLLVLTGVLAIIALLLPVYPYRVEGNFILRSEEVAHLTAPFDGYIKSVEVRPGDEVEAESVLMRLNTTDLELEEASAVADQTRYLREAEKARATGSLADMRIALALADQAKARLDLVRYRLRQSQTRAPFKGVVVEGDLRQRIGAPVKQGEALFRIARLEPMYVEAEINERDVRDIIDKSVGEIAFVARPKQKYKIRVVRVEPAAIAKEKQNVFLVRCVPEHQPERWWRPGMSGVCKIDVDRRTLFWILTHRTVDFLRMYLWW